MQVSGPLGYPVLDRAASGAMALTGHPDEVPTVSPAPAFGMLGRAAWLMLTGDRLPARTAMRWGLVDQIGELQPHI